MNIKGNMARIQAMIRIKESSKDIITTEQEIEQIRMFYGIINSREIWADEINEEILKYI